MMLESLVLAAEVLQEPAYLQAAMQTANWLWQTNRQASGELWRIHWQGSSSVSGNQQDYTRCSRVCFNSFLICSTSRSKRGKGIACFSA
jgi:uncharacterized protein YyaL (SSP411 family)